MATVDNVVFRPRIFDVEGRVGGPDLRVDSGIVTVDADFLTAIETFAGLTGSTATDANGFIIGAASAFQIIVNVVPTSVPTTVSSDVRDGWRVTWPSGTQRTLQARGLNGALTDANDNGTAVNKADSTVTTFFDALVSAPPAGLGVQDPADGSNVTLANLTVNATTNRRQLR